MEGSMTRFLVFVLLAAMTALGSQISSSVPSDQPAQVTFSKDVLPVLQNNCQGCHRPGGIAPMSFLTYESTRPWAKAIKSAVVSRQMPPWFADPHVGEFRNAPKLTRSDIDTLAAWADTGAQQGEALDKVPALKWKDGWRTQPDVIVSMTEPYYVAAKGEGEIKEFFVPNPFKEDTWVTSIEIHPGNPSVVHHVIVQIPEQPTVTGNAFVVKCDAPCQFDGQKERAAVAQAQLAVLRTAAAEAVAQGKPAPAQLVNGPFQGGSYSDVFAKLEERRTGLGAFMTMEAVYAPGTQPLDFRFTDSAKLIRGGKPIRIEVHYTPNGKETTDQTMVGFTLAKAPAERRFVIMAPEHLIDPRKPIPAGSANWETTGELTFKQDAELVWFMPHMHLRGKDMTFRLIDPDGHEQTVLSAKFNFHWQLGYELAEPIKVTKGTRMIVTAHHDNSANNPLNPSPGQEVRWGDLTSQEMMLPWFGVVVDHDVQPSMIASYRPPDLDGPLPGPPGFVGRVVGPTGGGIPQPFAPSVK
jgi:hypothetical protein